MCLWWHFYAALSFILSAEATQTFSFFLSCCNLWQHSHFPLRLTWGTVIFPLSFILLSLATVSFSPLFHSHAFGNSVIPPPPLLFSCLWQHSFSPLSFLYLWQHCHFSLLFFFILSSVPTVSCPSSILSSMATLSFFRSFANGNTVIFPILFSQLMAMLLFSPVFHSLTSGKMIILLCQSLPDTLPS